MVKIAYLDGWSAEVSVCTDRTCHSPLHAPALLQSTLVGLEKALEEEFSRCPPVYAKPDVPKPVPKQEPLSAKSSTARKGVSVR